MRMSKQGRLSLMREEAIVLSAYKDVGGVWTIGVGHTAKAGPPIPKAKMKISLDEAIALFCKDLTRYEQQVTAAITKPLKQYEFDALGSWHYNSGKIRSGTVDDKINAGDVAGAIATLKSYRVAGGKVVAGLEARRHRESDMFLRGIYDKGPIPVYEKYPAMVNLVPQSDIRFPDASEPRPQTVTTIEKQDLPEEFRAPKTLWELIRRYWKR